MFSGWRCVQVTPFLDYHSPQLISGQKKNHRGIAKAISLLHGPSEMFKGRNALQFFDIATKKEQILNACMVEVSSKHLVKVYWFARGLKRSQEAFKLPKKLSKCNAQIHWIQQDGLILNAKQCSFSDCSYLFMCHIAAMNLKLIPKLFWSQSIF